MQQNAGNSRNPADLRSLPPRKNRDRLFKGVLVCVALVVLAVIAVPSYLYWRVTRPVRITRDFVGEYHATFEKIPESELAWPEYQRVSEAFQSAKSLPSPKRKDSEGKDLSWVNLRPGDEDWEKAKLWLDSLKPELDVVRNASERTSMGFGVAPRTKFHASKHGSTNHKVRASCRKGRTCDGQIQAREPAMARVHRRARPQVCS